MGPLFIMDFTGFFNELYVNNHMNNPLTNCNISIEESTDVRSIDQPTWIHDILKKKSLIFNSLTLFLNKEMSLEHS